MYWIRETNKYYTDKFNSKYSLVYSAWQSGYSMPVIIRLRNNETMEYTDLPLNLQYLLKPIIFEIDDYTYFIEHNSKEYIRIELAINLIKTMINF